MGTNYFLDTPQDREPRHIGKTSSSGPYCSACDISLVTGRAGGLIETYEQEFYRSPHRRSSQSGIISEKGNVCPNYGESHGMHIVSSYSFIFDMKPKDIDKLPDNKPVLNECGSRIMSVGELKAIISDAQFKITTNVGRNFS